MSEDCNFDLEIPAELLIMDFEANEQYARGGAVYKGGSVRQ